MVLVLFTPHLATVYNAGVRFDIPQTSADAMMVANQGRRPGTSGPFSGMEVNENANPVIVSGSKTAVCSFLQGRLLTAIHTAGVVKSLLSSDATSPVVCLHG